MDLRLKQAPVIWLAGFMGSGKSTAGKLLAKKLGWGFVDLDAEIERAVGKPITQIFAEQGEDAFRELEHQQLLSQIRRSRHGGACVVALGGGAFAAQRNRDAIEDCGVALWLDPPFPILWERVTGNDKRPLAKDRQAFESLYDDRRSSYALAPYRISAGTSEAAVAEILKLNLL
jgi:shikimate kinase